MTYENLDTELVNALLGNGRESLRSLGEQLDVSVTTVSNHLNDLEEAGAIKGYTPIVNYDRLGYDVTAILQLKVEGQGLPDITETLRSEPQIVSIYETTGDYDIIAIGNFRDSDDMNDQIKRILGDTDVQESNTSVVLNSVSEYEQFTVDDGQDD
ncbi:Lrp/AsnC family transcriptional regulator (plasmid) [Halorubrum sp. BOL3-1]|uniref:HTH-type transcriptional regulator Lrp n=1 Tax=Halorubrum sp. BOL3-1 TaxID=2497325 RepID=UPI001004F673|nr:HTH-type transcriptional regulator Lrp [Halorubrum sp. BOL3-1]QAU14486.1 Lrp/AsnC family transcriptional regulator [Halorubrum sp. BOL3-1]